MRRQLNSACEPQRHIVGSFSTLSASSNSRAAPGKVAVRKSVRSP
jgi:hypothetical protein